MFKLGPSAVVSGSEDDEDSKVNKGLDPLVNSQLNGLLGGRAWLEYILVRVLSCAQVPVRLSLSCLPYH